MDVFNHIFNTLMLRCSFLRCLGFATIIFKFLKKEFESEEIIKIALLSTFLITIGEAFLGFLLFIYLHPIVKFF